MHVCMYVCSYARVYVVVVDGLVYVGEFKGAAICSPVAVHGCVICPKTRQHSDVYPCGWARATCDQQTWPSSH